MKLLNIVCLFAFPISLAIAPNALIAQPLPLAQSVTNARTTYGNANQSDADFLVQMATISLTQGRLADIASIRTSQPAILQYANATQTMYGSLAKELNQLAQQHQFTVPTTAEKLPYNQSRSLQSRVDNLKAIDAKLFDATYIDRAQFDQREALRLTDDVITRGTALDVREFALKLRPKVANQLQASTQIKQELAASASPKPSVGLPQQ
jgi:predicted outer membrane protein